MQNCRLWNTCLVGTIISCSTRLRSCISLTTNRKSDGRPFFYCQMACWSWTLIRLSLTSYEKDCIHNIMRLAPRLHEYLFSDQVQPGQSLFTRVRKLYSRISLMWILVIVPDLLRLKEAYKPAVSGTVSVPPVTSNEQFCHCCVDFVKASEAQAISRWMPMRYSD